MSEQKPLLKTLDAVVDSTSFLNFVRALIADREDEVQKEKRNPSSPFGPGANGWENGSIETFLNAAVAWAETNDFGRSGNIAQSNLWQRFGYFLYAGKTYEASMDVELASSQTPRKELYK